MHRIFALILVVVLAGASPLRNASARPQASGAGNDIARLRNNILGDLELEAIETRLKELQNEERAPKQWWVDKHGIMRTIEGRPIGFWGIDDHPIMLLRKDDLPVTPRKY